MRTEEIDAMPDVAQAPAKEVHKDSACGCSCGGSHEDDRSARDILDRRYASGEISKDQYEHMKHDLASAEASAKQKSECC
jgi:hypothetical protein